MATDKKYSPFQSIYLTSHQLYNVMGNGVTIVINPEVSGQLN